MVFTLVHQLLASVLLLLACHSARPIYPKTANGNPGVRRVHDSVIGVNIDLRWRLPANFNREVWFFTFSKWPLPHIGFALDQLLQLQRARDLFQCPFASWCGSRPSPQRWFPLAPIRAFRFALHRWCYPPPDGG